MARTEDKETSRRLKKWRNDTVKWICEWFYREASVEFHGVFATCEWCCPDGQAQWIQISLKLILHGADLRHTLFTLLSVILCGTFWVWYESMACEICWLEMRILFRPPKKRQTTALVFQVISHKSNSFWYVVWYLLVAQMCDLWCLSKHKTSF